jgi:hypothetical protein
VSRGLAGREATAALREGSSAALHTGFDRWVAEVGGEPNGDQRDAMIEIAPFVDCARRLGLDPVDALGAVIEHAPGWLREAFASTTGYADVTLEALGWSVAETPDGPEYRFAWPP